MLVIDRDALGFVDILNLGHQTVLKVGECLLGSFHQRLAAAQILEETLQQLMGVDRTIREQVTCVHLLAVVDHHIAPQKDGVLSDGVIGFDHRDNGGFIILTLLDFHRAGLLAENRRLSWTTCFKQLFNPGQTLNDVTGLLTLEHQQCKAVSPLDQISVAHVQNGVR